MDGDENEMLDRRLFRITPWWRRAVAECAKFIDGMKIKLDGRGRYCSGGKL